MRLLFMFFMLCGSAPGLAQTIALGKDPSALLLLAVDKDHYQASLQSWSTADLEAKTLQTFRVALGKLRGDKEKRGDKRTPEGIYIVQDPIKGALPAGVYGPTALALNFPNPIDRALGKSGNGIWLHGAGDDARIATANATQGCVAFYNSDISALSRLLKPRQSVVVIADDVTSVNRPDDVRAVKDATRSWATAWSTRDIATYISYYAPQFKNEGRGLQAYRAYKDKVFRSYDKMSVKFDAVRVITHPKYALAAMNQEFDGDGRFSANGRKVLYWQKSAADGGWKIVSEEFAVERLEVFENGDALSASASFEHQSSMQEGHDHNEGGRTTVR